MVYKGSVRVGGDKFDEAIINYIRRNYGMLIGEPTAEAIKKNIGSAFPGSEVKEMEVKGRNLSEGVPRSFTISSNEILEALTDPLNQIVSSVKNALEQTPPELGADIAERGMMLTGGGALLRDLDRLLAEETGLPVLVAEDPLTCVVRGCGMALERMERLGVDLHQRVTRALTRRAWPRGRLLHFWRTHAARDPRPHPAALLPPGPSALTKLALFSALAVFLMVADYALEVHAADARGAGHRAAAGPARAAGAGGTGRGGSDYLQGLNQRDASEDAARRQLARRRSARPGSSSWRRERPPAGAARTAACARRAQPHRRGAVRGHRSVFAQGVHRPRLDPGRAAGSPVINDAGVLGQVTRVYPLSAEVTLLTDKDAAIPCINTAHAAAQRRLWRAGQGRRDGVALRGRPMPMCSVGDLLHTSGVDGVYPPGLPVARVTKVERKAEGGFARVTLAPVAAPTACVMCWCSNRCRRRCPPGPRRRRRWRPNRRPRRARAQVRASDDASEGHAP